MELSTEGLIINKHNFKESSIILTLFTQSKGVLKGVYKGGKSKRNFYKLQLGNLVNATWTARLEEHLGNFKVDLKQSSIPIVFNDINKLLTLKSVCELTYNFLPERDPMPELYNYTLAFLNNLIIENFFTYYIKWELILLKQLGYGLDFSKCGVCNLSHNVKYVSPKTGVAVCEKVGNPYKNKLLIIPDFFYHKHNEKKIINKEIIEALSLTGYFFDFICQSYNKQKSFSRNLLLKTLLSSNN